MALVSSGGGGWLECEGVVVLICPPNGVASLGVAVWDFGLGLLDGQRSPDAFRCLWVYGCGVRPYPWGLYAVWCLAYSSHRVEGVVGACEP